MTKSELINDIAYEMSGYLTSEGIDRLKTVITFKLVNINLTATETLPSRDVYDNEYIMKSSTLTLTTLILHIRKSTSGEKRQANGAPAL